MPPKKATTKAKYYHDMLGAYSTSVLKADFVSSYKNDQNFDMTSWLPFSGPLQLPTMKQVLMLSLFFKDEAGRKDPYTVKPSEINKAVGDIISKYWAMAGFETKTTISREVKQIMERYHKLQKDSKKTGLFHINKRAAFRDEGERLFDVATKNLEEKIRTDKIRSNLGVVQQDLSFLLDQRSERKMTMDKRDIDYEDRRGRAEKRRSEAPPSSTVTSEAGSSKASSQASSSETSSQCGGRVNRASSSVPSSRSGRRVNKESGVEREGSPASELESPEKEDPRDYNYNPTVKKPKMIEVSLPRDIITATVTENLDRTRSSNSAAMQNISSVLLTAVNKDGEKVGLDPFKISKNTIRRRRMVHRETLCEKAVSSFKNNMPEYLMIHYDGSKVKALQNWRPEMEAIIVTGIPIYREGKIIGKYFVLELINCK